MNKPQLLTTIKSGLDAMTDDEASHFEHLSNRIINTYTIKKTKAVVFLFDNDLDTIELITVNSDESDTDKLLKFISELQAVEKSYDS